MKTLRYRGTFAAKSNSVVDPDPSVLDPSRSSSKKVRKTLISTVL